MIRHLLCVLAFLAATLVGWCAFRWSQEAFLVYVFFGANLFMALAAFAE